MILRKGAPKRRRIGGRRCQKRKEKEHLRYTFFVFLLTWGEVLPSGVWPAVSHTFWRNIEYCCSSIIEILMQIQRHAMAKKKHSSQRVRHRNETHAVLFYKLCLSLKWITTRSQNHKCFGPLILIWWTHTSVKRNLCCSGAGPKHWQSRNHLDLTHLNIVAFYQNGKINYYFHHRITPGQTQLQSDKCTSLT